MIGRASILARLAGFSDCLIISPTCSVVPSSNSINVAEIGTEVVSLAKGFSIAYIMKVVFGAIICFVSNLFQRKPNGIWEGLLIA